jgi:phage holin, LL-H family
MNVQNVSDVVTAVAVALIPIIFGVLGKYFAGNKKALELLEVLGPLAKSAVAAVAKLQDDGLIKKSKAVEKVMDALSSLGFNDTDKEVIEDAVEKAYADMKGQLDKVYQDNAKEPVTAPNDVTKETKTVGTPLSETVDKDGNVIL